MCNSNTRQSLFCNAIATVLGMASMGVGMTSLVSNDWISDGSANKSGLLESCSESTGCQPYSEGDHLSNSSNVFADFSSCNIRPIFMFPAFRKFWRIWYKHAVTINSKI